MPNDFNGVIGYAKANATIHGQDWDGWCEAFVSDAGAFSNSFPNASAARHASHVYSPTQIALSAVPTGWLLWWDYAVDGHVAYAAPGGLALMASGFVTQPIHSHLGYVARGDYEKRSGHKYLGASPDHGGQYLVGVPHTIPAAVQYVTVTSGQTLTGIATAHGISLAKIEQLNPGVTNPNLIYVGQRIRVK